MQQTPWPNFYNLCGEGIQRFWPSNARFATSFGRYCLSVYLFLYLYIFTRLSGELFFRCGGFRRLLPMKISFESYINIEVYVYIYIYIKTVSIGARHWTVAAFAFCLGFWPCCGSNPVVPIASRKWLPNHSKCLSRDQNNFILVRSLNRWTTSGRSRHPDHTTYPHHGQGRVH